MSLAERVMRIDEILVHHRIHSEQTRAKNFAKYYSQVPIVYEKIREFLMKVGMYIPLKSSYMNLTSGGCLKLFNILSKDAREKLYTLLHTEYSKRLGWQDAAYSDFESDTDYAFASDVILYSYKQYKKRAQREEKLRNKQRREEEKAMKKQERRDEKIKKITEKYERKLEKIREAKEKRLKKLKGSR
jgi:hypothetical protein